MALRLEVPAYRDRRVPFETKLAMVVDRRTLFVLAFNFTRLDIDRSRSFGIVTRNPALVREATRLFECDTTRQPYEPGCQGFVVSPLNSRTISRAAAC